MTDLAAAIIQGIVEGLTEFLPVSSTAHIRVTQELQGLDRESAFWKMFTVVIQLGAILAVIAYFWKRLTTFARSFFATPTSHQELDQPLRSRFQHPFVLVLVSFFVTAIPCFLIDKFIGDNLESLKVIGAALIVGGILMVIIDAWCSRKATTEQLEQVTLKQAIVIGLFQILAAAFPGTSRSMSTIAGGQLMGLSRSTALEFSFFLSIPVMIAAAGYKLLQYLKDEAFPTNSQWLTLGAGFVTSFFVALAVIAWFMQWVRSRGFTPFAIYRVIAGVAILWWDANYRRT